MADKEQDYKYIMPHDSGEIERLRVQHEWVKGSMGHRLVFAPIDKGSERGETTALGKFRVLDSATADGYWLIDAARELPPDSELVGFDIADHLFQTTSQLPANLNVSFATQSLTEPFPSSWTSAFDLVHQRFIWGSLPTNTIELALQNLVRATKPGGVLQLVDVDMQATAHSKASPSSPDPPAFSMLRKLAAALLVDSVPGGKMKSWLESSGLEDITEMIYDMPAGVTHPEPAVGAIGRKNLLTVLEVYMNGYEASKGDTMGMSREEWNSLPEMLAREMDDEKWRGRCTIRCYVVWGRKGE
ncbi:MAG: hypothetical protein M1830_009535 [Pleopsidium flavum]|nr:MAG: hypothetical protein M1830_009535 [Pleopsidium flavum]